MEFEFEWHDAKSKSNERKHGVSFAETVFGDWLALTEYDPDHSYDEDRFLTVGLSKMGRLPIVSHTGRGDKVRIISARKVTRAKGKITKMATSPDSAESDDDDLRPEYDLRSLHGAVRGKYAERYHQRLRIVRLDEDVAGQFEDEAAVNEALREYLRGHHSERTSA